MPSKLQNIFFFNSNGAGVDYFGVGIKDELIVHESRFDFKKMDDFMVRNADSPIMILLSYDLKNSIENLSSANPNFTETPLVYLAVPKAFGELENENRLITTYGNAEELNEAYEKFQRKREGKFSLDISQFNTLDKKSYLEKVTEIKSRIQLGDIYEANFCYENKLNGTITNSVGLYESLNKKTQSPYSCYISINDYRLICSSMECYINKEANRIVSKPIKGTIGRGNDSEEDKMLVQNLENSQKDRSENIMIVDLVRNDLSKVAKKASVTVTKLCQVKTYENIHQMVSEVECKVSEDIKFSDIIKATFPMGSMTGAPKISAMQIIEEQEDFMRGWYSGTAGFILPNGDFRLNVIIRSIIENKRLNAISYAVGGAITDLSSAEEEYQETLTKSAVIRNILET